MHHWSRGVAAVVAAAAVTACGNGTPIEEIPRKQPVFATIDVHTHTNLTDGTHTQADVLAKALGTYQLDLMANSEHGGLSSKDADGAPWDPAARAPLGDSADATNKPIRDAYAGAWASPLAAPLALATTQLWRWQVLRDVSFPLVKSLAATYPTQAVVQGVEWNVPSHEHASVGIVGVTSGKPVADFEFMFDASDKDNSRNGTQLAFNNAAGATAATSKAVAAEVDAFGNALAKKYKTHADAVAGVAYLQKNFKDTSYLVVNHPSRKQAYAAADLRDLMVAGPDVAVGLEGFPGHQAEACRGGYGSVYYLAGTSTIDEARTARARTYGGADFMLAKVGGMMDSFWAEGRRFWAFVDSDFHTFTDPAGNTTAADFWPGQYAKTYVGAATKAAGDVVKGMKAGNVFAVQGDLISALDFRAVGQPPPGNTLGVSAFMGEAVDLARNTAVSVEIRFKSPATNANGDAVAVDHVDVIVGSLGSKAAPGDAGYSKETSDAAVVATLRRSDFQVGADGWHSATVSLTLDKSKFVRLRGTSLAIPAADTDADIDPAGNPKMDDALDAALCANTEAKAWRDLWFYSNPIFLNAK